MRPRATTRSSIRCRTGAAPGSSPPNGGPRPPPPKLKGTYLAAYEKWRQEIKAKNGQVAVTQSNCMPPGMPVIAGVGQYPVEFLFSPGRVTVHFEAWMQWRNIFTDGRAHPEDLDPTFQGDSIGHWEGDTLVVETVGIKEDLGLTPGDARPGAGSQRKIPHPRAHSARSEERRLPGRRHDARRSGGARGAATSRRSPTSATASRCCTSSCARRTTATPSTLRATRLIRSE